jgi:transcriptional regulator with XRE-family HTH domain
MVIGERLRAIREHKDMSQGEVEKRTGLLRCYVSRVENGHTVPSIETLEKWARALDVSMAELFSEDGEKPAALDLPAPRTVKPDRATANALRRITHAMTSMVPKDRALLVSFASKLAARTR